VAILWPDQPSTAINGHNFLCFGTSPARLLARAKYCSFSWLQNGSSRASIPVLRFSIFKPGFDSR
jgi:hypothetical protein